jgi:hypothetical protein
MIAPGFARQVRLFEYQMVHGQLRQKMADGKAGLAAADNDGVHDGGH